MKSFGRTKLSIQKTIHRKLERRSERRLNRQKISLSINKNPNINTCFELNITAPS